MNIPITPAGNEHPDYTPPPAETENHDYTSPRTGIEHLDYIGGCKFNYQTLSDTSVTMYNKITVNGCIVC